MLNTSFVNKVTLAWHFFIQEYQHGHQRLLRWTQAILLLFIITLSQTSASIQSYLNNNLQNLLGADAVLSQKHVLTSEQLEAVSHLTNEMVITQQANVTLTHQGKWQQVKLKAVDNSYPLQGELLTSTKLQAQGEATQGGPNVGEIWLDTRLFASFSLAIGDHIEVANRRFMVSRVLHHEPDRLMEGHSVAMRAMINVQEMQALDFSAALIRYRYLLAANAEQIAQLITWQVQTLPAAQIHHKQGAHPLALFWQRTENFIGLASIILFFMAAIAIEQLSQIHLKKDQYFSAICMSFGAANSAGVQISILKWFVGLMTIMPVVLLLSAALHWLFIVFLQQTFSELTWHFQALLALKSSAFVALVFAVFHLPVWFSLHKNSVVKLFNGSSKGISHWLSKLSSLLVLILVAATYSDNGLLTFMLVAAVGITIILMLVLSYLVLTLGEKLSKNHSGLMPFTLFMMKQRIVGKSTQILGVGLCAFLLLFTLILLKDLGSTMASYQRQHDGNVMISQATQSQLQSIQTWADDKNIIIRQAKPYLYAKLTEINGVSLKEFSEKPSDSLATFKHSIRLHWNESIPMNNKVISGSYWSAEGKQLSSVNSSGNNDSWKQISVEEEVMTDLGLKLGDRLTFFIAQQGYDFEIVASHVFKPGAGSITFWVQMPTAALSHINAEHYNMASLELSPEQWHLLAKLWQKFPTLRMISLKEMTEYFDRILAMVTQLISGFAVLIMLLAVVVMLASINAFESKEKKKNSIILSFGFTKSLCLKINLIEWLVTASITAVGAIVGTYISGELIYQSQFSLSYTPNFAWLFFTLSVILFFVTSFGMYASRKSLKSSVRQLMSET